MQQLVERLGCLELLATQLFFEDGGDLSPHIDAHFVEQCDGTNRETEVEQRAIQHLYRLPFQHQTCCFVHVGSEDAVDVETGFVLHHDRRFALCAGKGQSGGDRLGTGAGVGDDLSQRHLVDRTEVVQPDNPLGVARH